MSKTEVFCSFFFGRFEGDKIMNRLLATLALIGAFTTSAYAEGKIWSWSNEITAEYAVDAEKTTLIYEPDLDISVRPDWTLSLGTVISMYDSSASDSVTLWNVLEDGSRPDLDMELSWAVRANTEAYAKTSWDIDDAERKDITIGMSFSF